MFLGIPLASGYSITTQQSQRHRADRLLNCLNCLRQETGRPCLTEQTSLGKMHLSDIVFFFTGHTLVRNSFIFGICACDILTGLFSCSWILMLIFIPFIYLLNM
jgi:hypothetical protein